MAGGGVAPPQQQQVGLPTQLTDLLSSLAQTGVFQDGAAAAAAAGADAAALKTTELTPAFIKVSKRPPFFEEGGWGWGKSVCKRDGKGGDGLVTPPTLQQQQHIARRFFGGCVSSSRAARAVFGTGICC
jgi:hypothetical protein